MIYLYIEEIVQVMTGEQSSLKKRTSDNCSLQNAAGQALPPIINLDAKNLNHAWTSNEVSGTKYGLSDNGWITTELFEGWMTEHFLEHAVS